ncbi:hydroxymethylbilane synthase [Bdellovibrio svalbardensis]|uniref:Hydroxymethylbilane synthase n=1 Tax=Bdellovibrio svalbardensis TaxID=2972972 RepID=A0ABT6DEP2_9BACT|nr:hydroxymethylbilane synthase [Bdellovibrio svalbardensis]MDG0815309.1 hydroxymethylbilane synthase [Bdellovibrio svalbardensis]
MRLKISARKSDLARLQAYMVGDSLKAQTPGLEIEYRFKESLGDKNLTDALWQIPEKGVFTEDFYGELIRGETDMVVHSWKDLPTEVKADTAIVATLPRADQRDLLLVKKSHFEKLRTSKAMRVFSSSPRREYNLTGFFKSHLPFHLDSVKFESVRGNIPTRIRKLLEANETDGLIVAKAALDRLLTAPQEEFADVQKLLRGYLDQLEWMALPLSINPNAAAQGALAVEILATRSDMRELLSKIDHPSTFACADKERKVLASFGGGCHQKIGVAVLSRPYGEITILKGLTDAGVVLDKRELIPHTPVTKYSSEQMWSGEVSAERAALTDWTLPNGTNALYVARSEAWPETLQAGTHYVWTAGLKTWKSLAQKGIWVHGSSESMGEQEEARLDILAGVPVKWAKLSHDSGFQEDHKVMPLVATYTLHTKENFKSLSGKETFFWSSGSQFLAAAEQAPEILKKQHACGPGNTHKVIQQYLAEKNMYDPSCLRIFLDQEDWRQQCTK